MWLHLHSHCILCNTMESKSSPCYTYCTQCGGSIHTYWDTLQWIFWLWDPKGWCRLLVTPLLLLITTHCPFFCMISFFGNKKKGRACSPHMHCPVLVTVSIRLLPHSGETTARQPFNAAHGTHGAALHEWPPWSHVVPEQSQISCKVDTERPLLPQENICGTLLRQSLRSGTVLPGSGNLAWLHKKPGQNAYPAKHVH